MKRLPIILMLIAAACFVACSDDDETSTEETRQWRDANNSWLAERQAMTDEDGTPYYDMIVPRWDPSSFVLIHYFNERNTDPNALKPLYTSTVDVRYELHLYNDEPVDSSTNLTTYGPGIYRSQLNGLIDGWAAAVCDMNVGDTAEVIVPYTLGYGQSTYGTIPAYSNLRFNIRLVDIYRYEITPN